jgi:excisionase family DNA binding protein
MDRPLTVDQAGELWNNGPRFVRRLIGERRIELVAHGSAWRIGESALIRFVEAGSRRPCRFLLQVDIHECGSPTLRQTSAITFRAPSGARYRPRQVAGAQRLRLPRPDPVA